MFGGDAGWLFCWERRGMLEMAGFVDWLSQAIDKGILDGAEGIALDYLTAVK